jgi:hypothetical protein
MRECVYIYTHVYINTYINMYKHMYICMDTHRSRGRQRNFLEKGRNFLVVRKCLPFERKENFFLSPETNAFMILYMMQISIFMSKRVDVIRMCGVCKSVQEKCMYMWNMQKRSRDIRVYVEYAKAFKRRTCICGICKSVQQKCMYLQSLQMRSREMHVYMWSMQKRLRDIDVYM